jgi:hypothetical protein
LFADRKKEVGGKEKDDKDDSRIFHPASGGKAPSIEIGSIGNRIHL